LAFESDSKLARIERVAFWGCKALKSICIPQGIQQLDKDWYVRSSLGRVIFESSVSLQTMIEGRHVDLGGRFDVCLVDWDSGMSFAGYSVSILPGVEDLVQLVKKA
jgi:hypothetical protein